MANTCLRENTYNIAVCFLIGKEILKPYFDARQVHTNVDGDVC